MRELAALPCSGTLDRRYGYQYPFLIALTSNPDPEERAQSLMSGAAVHLVKADVRAGDLLAILQRLTKGRSS